MSEHPIYHSGLSRSVDRPCITTQSWSFVAKLLSARVQSYFRVIAPVRKCHGVIAPRLRGVPPVLTQMTPREQFAVGGALVAGEVGAMVTYFNELTTQKIGDV